MSKLKCNCGNILSNVSESNKIDYAIYDEHGDTLINVWVCDNCKNVHIESNHHDIDGWYKPQKDDIKDTHRKEVKAMFEKIDRNIMVEIDQAEKELVDNFFSKGA